MSQWGNTDDAANSVLWATDAVNLPANTTNQAALFGNTTVGAFNNNGVAMNKAVGQFGLDVAELAAASNATISQYIVVSGGSGYSANAVVTVADPSGAANTQLANSTVTAGKVTAVTANLSVGGYTTTPAISIAAPTAINIVSNTAGFSNTADCLFVATANSKFAVGDSLTYAVPAGNTAIAPLVSGTTYYVQAANTTAIKLSATPGGAAIDITDARNDASPETHTITGATATASAVISGVRPGAAHTGWVLRTVGTGGRAGRVQYETLVAFGGNFSNDATDDTVLPDA
jgi:hypothetical protein